MELVETEVRITTNAATYTAKIIDIITQMLFTLDNDVDGNHSFEDAAKFAVDRYFTDKKWSKYDKAFIND